MIVVTTKIAAANIVHIPLCHVKNGVLISIIRWYRTGGAVDIVFTEDENIRDAGVVRLCKASGALCKTSPLDSFTIRTCEKRRGFKKETWQQALTLRQDSFLCFCLFVAAAAVTVAVIFATSN